jgi:hypothetical protein
LKRFNSQPGGEHAGYAERAGVLPAAAQARPRAGLPRRASGRLAGDAVLGIAGWIVLVAFTDKGVPTRLA